jgi:lysophospholipase L1-like esterase
MRRPGFIWTALLFTSLPSSAVGLGPIAPETVGTWKFQRADRPLKVIVLGGSVTAWPKGNFGQFLEASCPRIEVVNRGKARIGAAQLRERLVKQVLQNRVVKVKDQEAVWLVFQGGLNSVGTPETTNREVARIFKLASQAGIRTIGLTLSPWGSFHDKSRWRYARGLEMQRHTRLAVDFVMRRLTPPEALGSYARGRERDGWDPGELPDLAVDLYDSALRDREAPLWEEREVRPRVKTDPWVKGELARLAPESRAAALEAFVAKARELPRWFLRKDLQAFDPIHPHMEGHRIIAQAICQKLPPEWGCQCAALASMRWGKDGLEPVVAVAGP